MLKRYRFAIAAILLSTACQSQRHAPEVNFKELSPLPDHKALWTSCGAIAQTIDATGRTLVIAGHRYRVDKTLGEGGKGIVKSLIDVDHTGQQLVLKELKKPGESRSIYDDLLLRSTMDILGVPSPRVGAGYIEEEGKERQYVLIKELVAGPTLDKILIPASLKAMNPLGADHKERAKMEMAGRVYSRVINAGIYISDMHSRNIMWDNHKKILLMVDGNIEASSLTQKIDPKKGFGRAIGILGPVGDRIFYSRFYVKNERASSDAVETARQRLQAFFHGPAQWDCLPPPEAGGERAYEIDAHKVFAQ